MTANQVCQRCGSELTESTSRGLCPSCLLREGLADAVQPRAEDGGQRAEVRDQKTEDGGRKSEDRTRKSEDGIPDSSLATPHSSLPTHFGDYELLELIARGGMGVVYKARQKSLNRIVALKMLLFGPEASPEFVKRFRAEAVAAASLQHPHIVAIHEVGVHEGQHFFVMDYVAGPSLAQLVGHEPLPARRAASYLKTIAAAIHYAHERGILHRDLKPSNVLIDAQDQPRVTDFGLAKRFEGESQVTFTGQVLGSPSYIPPEQALGKRAKVSRQSDVYALGAMLYHLLTGRPPFQGETVADTLQQVLNLEPVSPRVLNSGIPPDLETICLKCLEKEASRRYPTAQELAEELGRFLDDKPIQARPVSAAGKAWKWCRRRPALAGMGVALALTFGLGLAGVLWQWHRARQIAQTEFRERERAEASELLARQSTYSADMHLTQLALSEDNRAFAVGLLEKYRPASGAPSTLNHQPSTDLRDWEWRYLWQLCRGDELFTLHRYPHRIQAVAVSKDGQVLAVTTGEEVALWDLTTRRPVTEWRLATTEALAFSPAGDRLAVGTRGTTGPPGVALLDPSTGKATRTLPSEAQVRSVAFSPDGHLLATIDSRGSVKVSDWASDRTLTNFMVAPLRARPTGVVVFSPDGSRLAIGEDRGRAQLLDLRTGTVMPFQKPTIEGIPALAFSPTDGLLAAAIGRAVVLWDTSSGGSRGQLTNHTEDVSALAFTADGRELASASSDGTIRVWSVADHTERHCLRTHGEWLSALAVLPDGRTLVTGGAGGSLCLWDTTGSRRVHAHTNLVIASGFEYIVGLEGARIRAETLDPRAAPRLGLAFTPDSQGFITTDRDGSLAFWDARSVRVTEDLPSLGSNHWAVALSPDGHWLAAGNTSGKLTIWDWTARRAVTNFTVPFEWFGRLRFSRSGHFLFATVMNNEWVVSERIWRTADWEEVLLTGAQFAGLWSVDLSPDDRFLAAGYANGAVKLFRFPSKQLEATFAAHNGMTHAVFFSPNGRVLISASTDGSARLWDVVARRELPPPLRGHVGAIYGAALSPDGRRLATGGQRPGDAVKLWDLVAHREVLSLQGEGQYFLNPAFSPDGNTLVALSLDGFAHLWCAPSWEEIEAVEKRGKAQ